jgi:hypothetical protein
VSFKKVVEMTSEIKRSYLPPSYHDIYKRLFNDTKNTIKVQIEERTKIFIQTYGVMLASDCWSLVNNNLLFNMMCVSLVGKKFLRTINTLRYTKNASYIIEVIRRYLIEVGP